MKPIVWKCPKSDDQQAKDLAEALSASSVLAKVLLTRGLSELTTARQFLTPRLLDLEEPDALIDVTTAARRLVKAARDKERIVVYGDYDVDGIVGSVILLRFLKLCGARVEVHIPNRLKDGYSFNVAAVESLLAADEPPGLVVTVDHGTSAHEAIARLTEGGVDVVVTDHHEPPPTLPTGAHAIVNPRRADCPSSFKDLCGAGVAFKVTWEAAKTFCESRKVSPEFREFLLEAMGLVALATVTDVMPLHGDNRILTLYGLKAIEATESIGLRALLRKANLKGRSVQASHCGYRIGPRINAAGRMGIAELAVELLTTTDAPRATALANRLEEANDARRLLERDLVDEIVQDPKLVDFDGRHGLCVGKRGWHVGVIGIVASRLVDRFAVPAIVVGFDENGLGRASARSIPGVHLRDVLAECAEHTVQFGGHAGAAGATLMIDQFTAFRTAFEAASARAMAKNAWVKSFDIDAEIALDDVRAGLIEDLARLAPHGAQNPMPLFLTRDVHVAGTPKLLGSSRSHVTFFARHGGRAFRAVVFEGRDHLPLLREKDARVDLCYHLKFDSYTNPGSVELEVRGLRRAETH